MTDKRADNIAPPKLAPTYVHEDVFTKGLVFEGSLKLLISAGVSDITIIVGNTDDYSIYTKTFSEASISNDTMAIFTNLRTFYNAVNNAVASPENGFSKIRIDGIGLRLQIVPLERWIPLTLNPVVTEPNARIKLMKKDFSIQLQELRDQITLLKSGQALQLSVVKNLTEKAHEKKPEEGLAQVPLKSVVQS